MSFLRKYFSFSTGVWFNALIGILWTAYISRHLNPDELGIITMYMSLYSGLSALALMGSSDTIMRFYREYELKNYLVWLTSLPSLIMSLLIFLAMLFLRSKVNFIIWGEKTGIFFLLIPIQVSLNVVFTINMSLIRSQERGLIYSAFSILDNSLYTLFTIIVLTLLRKNFIWVIFSSFLSLSITSFCTYLYLEDYWKFSKVGLKDLREILSYSFPLTFGSLLWWFTNWTDRFMLRGLSNFNEIGLYSVGSKFASILNLITSGFSTLWFPYAYSLFQSEKAKDMFKKMSMMISFLTFNIALIINLTKHWIFQLLFSKNYIKAINVVPFLLLPVVLTTILVVVGRGINFSKKTYLSIYTNGAAIVTNIIINYLLIPKLGAIGAAIGTAISFIIFFTVEYIFSIKFYKVNYQIWKVYTLSFLFIFGAILELFNSRIFYYFLNFVIFLLALLFYYNEFKILLKKFLSILEKTESKGGD
ncbi:MAG: oligosaccharide flippase family protein [Fervidobacterium sp.]|nr:oligosaccharide flippase family protein [Fervidobacterium sp.]